mmetsp:Transcript_9836/g.17368  ORF Transcript_9836/g.17368 Transcript_9836/m.17368 type:complete len:202 (-) Transcript_9836:581-1186(-)
MVDLGGSTTATPPWGLIPLTRTTNDVARPQRCPHPQNAASPMKPKKEKTPLTVVASLLIILFLQFFTVLCLQLLFVPCLQLLGRWPLYTGHRPLCSPNCLEQVKVDRDGGARNGLKSTSLSNHSRLACGAKALGLRQITLDEEVWTYHTARNVLDTFQRSLRDFRSWPFGLDCFAHHQITSGIGPRNLLEPVGGGEDGGLA